MKVHVASKVERHNGILSGTEQVFTTREAAVAFVESQLTSDWERGDNADVWTLFHGNRHVGSWSVHERQVRSDMPITERQAIEDVRRHILGGNVEDAYIDMSPDPGPLDGPLRWDGSNLYRAPKED